MRCQAAPADAYKTIQGQLTGSSNRRSTNFPPQWEVRPGEARPSFLLRGSTFPAKLDFLGGIPRPRVTPPTRQGSRWEEEAARGSAERHLLRCAHSQGCHFRQAAFTPNYPSSLGQVPLVSMPSCPPRPWEFRGPHRRCPASPPWGRGRRGCSKPEHDKRLKITQRASGPPAANALVPLPHGAHRCLPLPPDFPCQGLEGAGAPLCLPSSRMDVASDPRGLGKNGKRVRPESPEPGVG